MMKNRFILIIGSLLLSAIFLGSCEQADGDRDYGYGYVLMPQSQRIEGFNPVPSGGGKYTYNFAVEDGVLKIFLGVLRSGKIANAAFTVDVTVNGDKAQRFVTSFESAQLMPTSMFTIPNQVSVASNSNQAAFRLEIPVAELKKTAYDGKKLVTCVELSNPSQFTLSEDAFSTIVVVDVNAIRNFFD